MSDEKLYDPRNGEQLQCEVCGKESAVGVAAMPGVPYSAAYGRACLDANAHPYDMLVLNTAMIVGAYAESTGTYNWRRECAIWWVQMVDATLAHLKISPEKFEADVLAGVAEFHAADQEAEL